MSKELMGVLGLSGPESPSGPQADWCALGPQLQLLQTGNLQDEPGSQYILFVSCATVNILLTFKTEDFHTETHLSGL